MLVAFHCGGTLDIAEGHSNFWKQVRCFICLALSHILSKGSSMHRCSSPFCLRLDLV